MPQKYKKNTSAELDAEFKAAESFGALKLGKNCVFWKKNTFVAVRRFCTDRADLSQS